MEEVKIDPKIGLNAMIKIIVNAYHQGRAVSAFYRALGENRGCSTLHTKKTNQLNIEILDEEWYKMVMTQCTTTNS